MAYSQFANHEALPAPEATSLPCDLPPPNDLAKAKKYVRNGRWKLQQGIRRHLWRHLLGVTPTSKEIETFRTQKTAYFENEGQTRNLRIPDIVKGDFSLAVYQLNKEGMNALQAVLTLVAMSYPQISYCPLLTPFASLCLHFMTEEETYACVVRLVGKEFASEGCQFLPSSAVAHAALSRSLFLLVTTADPKGKGVNNTKNLVHPRDQFEQWVWWVWRELPLSHVVRVADVYIVEGLKALYRAALSILTLQRKHSDNTLDEHAIRNFVRAIDKHADEEKFIKLMYKVKMPTRAEITKATMQAKNEAETTLCTINNLQGPAITLESISSDVITQEQLFTLWGWLPAKSSVFQPTILYQTSRDGFNLNTLYRNVEKNQPIVLIINTLNQEVFGAYISANLSQRHRYEKGLGYFGDGQTFLFSLSPSSAKYPWANDTSDPGSSLFVSAQAERLVVGGGNHEGIALDWALDKGTSQTCTTFQNPPLCTSQDFKVKNVEILGLRED